MGKVKKPRLKKNKKTSANDNSHEEEHIDVDSKENIIQTIIDQLQTANVEEKCCGLQTLAILIENPENVQQVIDHNLARIVAPLLLDSATSVRNAAAGTLRNLSAVGLETCDALMDQDVMTSLTFYFHEHAKTWVPDSNSKTKDEDTDTVVQCINLLWNLCESSELAIKYLGQSQILDILARYLDLTIFGSDIVIAVLQCLIIVVEDNPVAMEKLKVQSETQLQHLLTLDGNEPANLLIRTLAAGVTVNTCGGNIATLPVNVIHEIILILANTLSVDHRMACSQLSSNVPLNDEKRRDDSEKLTLDSKAAKILESQVKSVSQVVDAQQSSIEIITNMCSCDDDDDSIDNDDNDSDEMDDELCNRDEETTLVEDKLLPEIIEALTSMQIFDKVWARAHLPAENVMLILSEYEGTQTLVKKLYSVQSRALLCVNNMLCSLPASNFGGGTGVYKIWVDAGKLVFKQKANNASLLESATAVMRAALEKLKVRENGIGTSNNLFQDLALTDVEMMLNGIKECQVPEIRSNLIRMIGTLALLLMDNMNDITTNVICTITEFILDQAHRENEVWVMAEALDTIVDLYSEDETDAIATKVKLLDKLAVLAPVLKNKARQQKKLPKEYKVLVSTATSNLPRFIKYKSGRLGK